MPKRVDLHNILIIGSGPIVIGQACEFDYSGTQACSALKEAGFRVILVNSNPATIMTDPSLADATYIEPITPETIERIIQVEKPDAILPTMGGQTGLNCAMALYRQGILDHYNVALIGASYTAINQADNREQFKQVLARLGLASPQSFVAHDWQTAQSILNELHLPAIIRPSFTLGGEGGGIAYTPAQYRRICLRGLQASRINEIQIDESIIGWKEFELELMRDCHNNSIVVCSIENLDPVGIHTGDSITVAPAQTLTDKEYQVMRDAAIAIMREVGVDTGGANVQFAVNPDDGQLLVIEMNPRVSRSSALASKATGYPIAKLAAKLAVGYTLDELLNEITGSKISAAFEPVLDYVVTKIPRFDFEKFPELENRLGTSMQSVGEVMAIGRTFQQSFQKALCSLEQSLTGLNDTHLCDLSPSSKRILSIAQAFREHQSVDAVYRATQIDPWFLYQIKELVAIESFLKTCTLNDMTKKSMQFIKEKGFSDARLAEILNVSTQNLRQHRKSLQCTPVFKRIDTCSAEFRATTEYLYSTYDQKGDKTTPSQKQKILILGSGPNRIGQGIEFDYCCVHAVQAVRKAGYEAIMINCNPETVSTDHNLSDKLYFEPLAYETIMDIIDHEQPWGVIVQFGGQTPLKLAGQLKDAGIKILGSDEAVTHNTENRDQFQSILNDLDLYQPPNVVAYNNNQCRQLARRLGYPLIVRPSYVLGGTAMKIIEDEAALQAYLKSQTVSPDSPLLVEKFLDQATEVEVDAVCDGNDVIICGVMEHIENAGVHSGDSACVFPPRSLDGVLIETIKQQIKQLTLAIKAVGLINAQLAIKKDNIYIIEVNPRASRTIPFISKATGIPWVEVAVQCMLGHALKDQGILSDIVPQGYYVKESVLPFAKLPGSLPLLSPEMESTGEVMGRGQCFAEAFLKSQRAAGFRLPQNFQNEHVIITAFHAQLEHEWGMRLDGFMKHGLKIFFNECIQLPKNFDNHRIFKINKTQAASMIQAGKVAFIVHISGHSDSNWLDILQMGLQYGISYVTSQRALKMFIHSLSHSNDSLKPVQN